MKKLLLFALVLSGMQLFAQTPGKTYKTQNVIVITIDGLRWQDVFTGADSLVINKKEFAGEPEKLKKKYWTNNPDDRRKLLMPFLWETIAKNGQIYGNRLKGSNVNVENPFWFSYPGYNEIFTGYGDPRINSNEFGPNPNVGILEFANQTPEFKGKVAAFSSWDAFPDILNKKRSCIPVDAGFEKSPQTGISPEFDLLHKLQNELPDALGGARLDAITFNLGMEYLKIKRPRVLYLAFDETDDFAHGGKYDLYLNSANYTDNFIKQLWQWVQSQEDYKDKTTILITVDHGRGLGDEWKDHGSKTAHSSETWFAVIGPDTKATGEASSGQFYNAQYAQTIAKLLGIPYVSPQPIGAFIPGVLKK